MYLTELFFKSAMINTARLKFSKFPNVFLSFKSALSITIIVVEVNDYLTKFISQISND